MSGPAGSGLISLSSLPQNSLTPAHRFIHHLFTNDFQTPSLPAPNAFVRCTPDTPPGFPWVPESILRPKDMFRVPCNPPARNLEPSLSPPPARSLTHRPHQSPFVAQTHQLLFLPIATAFLKHRSASALLPAGSQILSQPQNKPRFPGTASMATKVQDLESHLPPAALLPHAAIHWAHLCPGSFFHLVICRLCSETLVSRKPLLPPGSACSLCFSHLVLVMDGEDRLPFLYAGLAGEEVWSSHDLLLGVMATKRWDLRDR